MKRSLSILYVAYPLLRVTDESAGGAEQMLLAVEREMAALGHRTMVAAADGSRVFGRLLPTGSPANAPDQYEAREREHNDRILDYLRRNPRAFELIHDESGSFFRYAAQCPVPVLATLHLPREFYKRGWFGDAMAQVSGKPNAANLGHPQNAYFNCVSNSQARSFADLQNFVGVVQNGIAVERFPISRAKDDYVLWLGRICEEKAPHLAVAVAQRANMPLVIAGQVYPFSYHQSYFDCEVRPHLNGFSRVRFVDTPLASQKLELLRHARALLLTSTVEETSSLVAMEAMACGTPVVAVRRGAFPEIVSDGETGFLVESVEEMAATSKQVKRISPQACRARVEQHFSAARMARDYEALYRRVLGAVRQTAAA